MILELHIHNLAVIEDTTMEFTSRNTALIGETGAGKSLVVNSLLLLTGSRSDFSLVRDSSRKAFVSALFHIEDGFLKKHPELEEYVDDAHDLLIKRVLNPDKTSRYYLNDESVTANELKAVTGHLIDIHSQNAKSDLLDETRQIKYLDLGSEKIQSCLEEYQKSYRSYLDKKKELDELYSSHKEYDRDYLEFQIKEIEKYNLRENEIEDLNEEFLSLREQDRLKDKYQSFQTSINSSSMSLNDILSLAGHQLKGLIDTTLKDKAENVYQNILSLQESLNDLDYAFEEQSIDPKRIDEINERLFSLKGLMRKYGKTTEEILNKYRSFKEKLDEMDNFEARVEDLKAEIQKLYDGSLSLALKLSERRHEFAEELTLSIQQQMGFLGLRKNGFNIQIDRKEVLDNEGFDKVTFMVSLNAGLESQSLSKAASGGESSRIMLALKIALNQVDPYDLMVLDEIDTGISGKAAYFVASKIRSLSKQSSLIVISHLPQVVSSCDQGIRIEKKTIDDMTFTTASSLSEEEMIQMIASMISLDKVTDNAISQAKELYSEFHK